MTKPITEEMLKEELTPEQLERFQKTLKDEGLEEALYTLPDLGVMYETTTEHTSVNQRIKELRIDNGLTQVELANVLNLSHKEYWRYEQDGYSLGILKLIAIAMFYNVSLDWITGMIDTKRPIIDNTEIFETNCVNGYSLKEMKEAKSRGEKYEPHKIN